MIDGILITPLKKIIHPKGDLFHVIKESSDGYLGFGEVYISTIKKNKIKGVKNKNVRCSLVCITFIFMRYLI